MMPELSTEEVRAYEKLVRSDILKVPLSDNRDMDWLFALWDSGNMLILTRIITLPLLYTYIVTCIITPSAVI